MLQIEELKQELLAQQPKIEYLKEALGYQKLLEQKEKGAGVLLISADLDEVLAVSDRVLVINEGEIMGEFIPGEIDYTEIGLMMGGTRRTNSKAGETA